jgi:hypothetical protein
MSTPRPQNPRSNVPKLTPEQMDLAEAAIRRLMKARYPGRPITVHRTDRHPAGEVPTPHEAGSP